MADTLLLTLVKDYLLKAAEGKTDISDALVDEFGELCKKFMRDRFKPREEKAFTIRMSNVGRPLCQLQMEQNGVTREQDGYAHTMKMLIGDMTEAAAVTVMKAAGVNVQGTQTAVKLAIAGTEISGTSDINIAGKVYDIKSASPYSFANKFAKGFSAIVDDDPFGYVAQGYMYAQADNKDFGGWIVVNKSTGEWLVCEPPIADRSYRKQALEEAFGTITALTAKAPFKRCFEAEKETWYGKATGNMKLGVTCSYCPWKHTCWSDTNLVHAPNPRSKSENAKYSWYIGEPK